MFDIREHIKPLSDKAISYITNVVAEWPTKNGFPRPPAGKHVDDSIAQEINHFVRQANMHLGQLVTEAGHATPGSGLGGVPGLGEQEMRALQTLIRTEMRSKSVSARAFPHRVADLLKVNNVITELHAVIARGEAATTLDEPPDFGELSQQQQIDTLLAWVSENRKRIKALESEE